MNFLAQLLSEQSVIHILHIEDSADDAGLIEQMLKESWPRLYAVTRATRIKDAIKLLSEDPSIDIILSDITLPDSQGGETFHSLKKLPQTCRLFL